MVVLADSSIWIDHFRDPQDLLWQMIGRGELWTHPHVICELALGSVPDRKRFIAFLVSLPRFGEFDQMALIDYVQSSELHGKGVGMVDASLLMSCAENNAKLWTRDKRLLEQAARLNLDYAA